MHSTHEAVFYLGYKLYARSDKEGYIEALIVTAANAHETGHLKPGESWLIKAMTVNTTVAY